MHTASPFKFALGQVLTIAESGDAGEVIARSDSQRTSPQYLLRYKCTDDHGIEAWCSQDDLIDSAS